MEKQEKKGMSYHISQRGVNIGKYSESEILAKLADGTFSRKDHYWAVGMAGWRPLTEFNAAPAPGPQIHHNIAHSSQQLPPVIEPASGGNQERAQLYGYIGSALLGLGGFMPFLEVGMVSASVMRQDNSNGPIMLVCAVVSAVLSNKRLYSFVWIPALAASSVTVYMILHILERPSLSLFGTRIPISPGIGLFSVLAGCGLLLGCALVGSKNNRKTRP